MVIDTALFQKILEPIQIGDMLLRNRIVMAPMLDNFDDHNGYPTERKKKYLEERAKYDIGLIIIGSICIDSRTGRAHRLQLLIDDDKYISGLRAIVHAVQRYGSKVCAQIHHFGLYSDPEIMHLQNLGPSALIMAGRAAREMTLDEIKDTVNRHIEAAIRAKKAGFDAVEVMMGGGYLLGSFLSAVTNKRKDNYGGELENRARICIEILRGIRERLGTNFPIGAKFSPSERGAEYGIEGCFSIEEGKQFARMLEEAGISYLNIQSRGHIKSAEGLDSNYYLKFPEETGPFMSDVLELRKDVKVPLMTTGRLTPEFAEPLLQEGKIDLMGVARGFLVEPEFAGKIASGDLEDIAPCINCLYCLDDLFDGGPLACAVNPAVGREAEYEIKPANGSKKVLIIGGGPAGMEAARVSAMRGHEVVLYEKDQSLGGQLRAASVAPTKRDIGDLITYLETQLRKLGVRVELNKEAAPLLVEEAKPDVVVVATGASRVIPEIPGGDGENVVMAEDVLLGKVSVGRRIIVIGGGMVGCETADFLGDKGNELIIVEMLEELASGMSNLKKRLLLDRLNEKRVTLLVSTRVLEVTESGVVVTTHDGERKTLEADTVVLATETKAKSELFWALEGQFSELYLVGDGVEPRRIAEAMDEGFRIGCLI